MPGGEQVIAGLVALSLAKKAAVYLTARYYGFPRLYRRFLNMHKKLDPDPIRQAAFKVTTKRVMRFPNRIGTFFRRLTQQQQSHNI